MRRILILLVVVGLGYLAWTNGLADAISWEQLARHQRTLSAWTEAHPVLGAACYVIAYGVAAALSLPVGLLFSTAGGLLFGALAGTVLAATGATLGATVLFLIARSAFGGSLAYRGGPAVQALRGRLQRDGFHYLLAIRLMPLFPFWLVNLAAALCGISLLSYITATALGILPVSGVLAWTGAGLVRVLASGERPDVGTLLTWPVLAPLTALAAVSLVPVLWRRKDA